MKTLLQVSPTLSVPEMNLTSSFFSSSDQLEYALHLLLSCIIAAGFSSAVGIRDDLHFLDFAYAVVKTVFFVTLHLQDPSLQSFSL